MARTPAPFDFHSPRLDESAPTVANWILMVLAKAINFYSRKVLEKSFFGQFLRKTRRTFLSYFKPDYITKSIAENRKGDCHRCGACCELVLKCPFLGKDAQNLPYCRVYGELRPNNCRNYPIDAVDSEIDQCGYTFAKPAALLPGIIATTASTVASRASGVSRV